MNDVMIKIILLVVLIVGCGGVSGVFATEENYDRLIKRDAFRHLDRPAVGRLQQNLALIYQQDLNWNRDKRLSQRPLTDGVMGPVTLFWLQQFVTDFKIEPVGDYVNQVNIRLERIASFASMFPEETKVLLSADFAHWNDLQLDIQRESYYNIRRSGSEQELLDLVYRYLQKDNIKSSVWPNADELTIHYYQLDVEDFKILQSRDSITQELAKLENKRYDNVALLAADVEAALPDFPKKIKRLLPFIQQYYAQSDLVVTLEFITAFTKKVVGDPLVTSLNPMLSELLEQELTGIAYPDGNLFDKAAQARIRAALGACSPTQEHNRYVLSLRFNDEDFEQLGKTLLLGPNYHGMPDIRQQLIDIGKLRSKKKVECEPSDINTVKKFVADLYDNNVQPSLALLYQKTPEYQPNAPIQWDGDGCGCVLDQLSGTVYGFYPFWLANEGQEQRVDFSVLSRVAYYGLAFDNKGNILQANNQQNKTSLLIEDGFIRSELNDFIHVAHKHNTRVDWVIQNNKQFWDDWQGQAFGARAAVFDSLAGNITRMLANQLTDGVSQLEQLLAVGLSPLPTQGNGVTLYFEDYPNDQESAELLNRLINNLRDRLNAIEGEHFINIMLPQSAIGTDGFFRYDNLITHIQTPNGNDESTLFGSNQSEQNTKVKILVLIEEPTTDSKKELRSNVENGGLNGEKRRLLLRNIIPVITFDQKNWEQLEDDLAYFKDNFGGVGFWPLAIEPAVLIDDSATGGDNENGEATQSPLPEITKSVSSYLVQFFQAEERLGQPDEWHDKIICENRAMFRVALSLLTLLSLFLLWYYFRSCCAQAKAHKWFVPGMVITILLTLITALLLLLYDPVLEKLSKGNLPLIAVLIVGALIWFISYQRRKKLAKKPIRPRIFATQKSA